MLPYVRHATHSNTSQARTHFLRLLLFPLITFKFPDISRFLGVSPSYTQKRKLKCVNVGRVVINRCLSM